MRRCSSSACLRHHLCATPPALVRRLRASARPPPPPCIGCSSSAASATTSVPRRPLLVISLNLRSISATTLWLDLRLMSRPPPARESAREAERPRSSLVIPSFAGDGIDPNIEGIFPIGDDPEAEEKRKKDEELEKQKRLEEESVKEEADAKLLKVLDRLDTLEGVVKEIVVDKRKAPSPDLPIKEDIAKKDEVSQGKASDSKSNARDSQPVTVKSKDINCAANAPANTAQPNSKGNGDKAFPAESKS
ncbi:hypothetical protein U9M48_005806 [Paspalum notatum var. saurae]|uniref:Uncharacterized protein n=1 Tax=Paspalum notatum var. saurae TaxID=547442 RepID=A0AAQ3SK98_PASNO